MKLEPTNQISWFVTIVRKRVHALIHVQCYNNIFNKRNTNKVKPPDISDKVVPYTYADMLVLPYFDEFQKQ